MKISGGRSENENENGVYVTCTLDFAICLSTNLSSSDAGQCLAKLARSFLLTSPRQFPISPNSRVDYAVIIGGAGEEQGLKYMVPTTYFVEWTLINVFNVPRDHIVYLADTADPGLQQGNYPYCDYNFTANKANVTYYISQWLASKTENTLIYVFSHGGGYDPNTGILSDGGRWANDSEDEDGHGGNHEFNVNGTWRGVDEGIMLAADGSWYYDDEFAQNVSSFQSHLTVVLQTCKDINDTTSGLSCFSGGFIEDLSGNYRTIITATNETGISYVDKPLHNDSGPFAPFTYGLFSAFSPYNIKFFPDGTMNFDFNSLINWNYNSSWRGAFEYALLNDVYYPDGQLWKDYNNVEFPWFDDDGNRWPGWYNNTQVPDFPQNETVLMRWLEGDLKGDGGIVGMSDIGVVARAFSKTHNVSPGDPQWNRQADVYPCEDWQITTLDLSRICRKFGGQGHMLNPVRNGEMARAKLWGLLLVVLLLPCVLVVRVQGQSGNPVVSVTPANSTVCLGMTFPVNITIANVSTTDQTQMVYTYGLELFYNNSVVNCTNVSYPPEHFLKPANDSDLYPIEVDYDNAYNSTCGCVTVIMSLLSEDENPKGGSGVLATVTFQAIGAGATPLQLDNVELVSIVPDYISCDCVDGSVQVTEPACAMKTLASTGSFYVPNMNLTTLRVELLFNSSLNGDQTGNDTSPYSTIPNYPDGKVGTKDIGVVSRAYGSHEGSANWNYMADITGPNNVPDRQVDMRDLGVVNRNFGKTGTYSTNITGVSVNFNTGQQIPPDDSGFATIPSGATSFNVTISGQPTGAMIVFWQ